MPAVLCAASLSVPVPSTDAMADERADMVVVSLEPGQDIRQLADLYLGDPNLWPDILKSSNVRSVAALSAGRELRIPVDAVTAAKRALDQSLQHIQDANAAGAQIFAPIEIAAAIDYRDGALGKRRTGDWRDVLDLALRARKTAVAALKTSRAKRDKAAEARLSDRQGWVEGQQPRELAWSDRPLNAILIEREKVRTLSQSTAQITFRDASRLRLNANSHAVIQRLRSDPMSRREESKVTLVEGDFYALLIENSKRKKFNVEIPQVDAKIESGNFWVRHDRSGAKFTNYDDREVDVTARGASVTIGRNEGVLVRAGEQPKEKLAVLSRPDLADPADDGVVYNENMQLRWAGVPDAAGYWIEIAEDPGFQHLAFSRWGLSEPRLQEKALPPGLYYWRVSAIDKFGLPGERSDQWRFDIRIDTAPPYLKIDQPPSGQIVRDPNVVVAGEAEPGATVTVDGQAVLVDDSGRYVHPLVAAAGENTLQIVALDAAGNATRRKRSFVYMADSPGAIAFDKTLLRTEDGSFLTGGKSVTLTGKTEADARIAIGGAGEAARATGYSDPDGRFDISVPVRATREALVASVTTRSGFSSTYPISVTTDQTPPSIILDEVLPRLTAIEWLTVRGKTESSIHLSLNGSEIKTVNDVFDEAVTLVSGPNTIELVATDAAGNVTVEKWVVVLDQTPPEFDRHQLTAEKRGNEALISVEVAAKDSSGLAKVAPYTLRAGAKTYRGHLRFNRAEMTYQGSLTVPASAAGKARLRTVELQDDAGNKKRIRVR